MTAILEADPRIGSTKPRLYTPPLPENCTGPEIDLLLNRRHPMFGVPQECGCGCGLNPQTSWGFTCIEFLEKILKWDLLSWQRWLYIHSLEKRPDRTGFRFRQLLVLVGRQQGKTTWGRGLGLWRLFMDDSGLRSPTWPAAKLCIVAAQNLDYAENTLKDVVDEIRNHPLLESELINHAVTNGKHRAILKNNRLWRAATANRKGGRSLPVDFAWLDEVREHTTWDAYNAIEPTTTMQVCSQLLVTSNAGDERSIVLKGLRDDQIRDLTVGDTTDAFTGFFEWSVPDDVDPRDPKFWHMAAPAMGHKIEGVVRLKLEDLIGKFKAKVNTDMAGFQTEYLALDIDTPILTTAGWKTMATIEVDDEVYHPDGHPVRVAHTTPIFADRTCYEVETTDGRRLVADADHRWSVVDRRRRNAQWETLTTAELLARGVIRGQGNGGKYAYRLPSQRELVSKPVDLPIDPYLVGLWLGDGTATKSEITCGVADLDELLTQLPAAVTSIRANGPAAHYVGFRLAKKYSRDGDGFPALCKQLGIWNAKRIPDVYLTAGTEQRLALLQGLCDTDGSIDDKGRVRFCSVKRELAEQVLYLARSLGWRATLTEGLSQYQGTVHGPAYCVAWTHDASEPAPFRYRRKLARIQVRPSRAGERTTISIKSITAVASRPVRCITVDSPDSLFLAGGDLVPTKNCQWVASLQAGVIPSQAWADRLDPQSRRAPGAAVYACIEINYQRTKSYVCVASRRADGDIHIEVAMTLKGTDGITTWLNEPGEDPLFDEQGEPLPRKSKFAGICAQKVNAPVSTELEEFRKAGIKIVEWGSPNAQLAAGAGEFYDALVNDEGVKVWHFKQQVLDRSAASTVSRSIGDAWFFDRKKSPVDASPIIGCCGAMWLLNNAAEINPPQIWEWPSDEILEQWRKEAEEQWKDNDDD